MTARTVSDEVRLPGHRRLTAGDEFSVSGQGRFAFKEYVQTEAGCHIAAFGGRPGRECWRYFRCDAVRTVHRSKRLRP